MSAPSEPALLVSRWRGFGGLLAALLLAVALWRIWACVCVFVGEEWNDVRLRPAWLIRDGLPLYPDAGSGPITTWLYGPVTPFLMLPATLAPGIEGTLLTAGLLNALLLAGAMAALCFGWPAPAGQSWSRSARTFALGVALLLLPEPFFVFLQADNIVIACGLAALTCLARAGASPAGGWAWLSAGFCAGAVFAKWHGVAVPAGSLLWLASTSGPRVAGRHLGRLVVTGTLGLGLTLLVAASPQAAWEGLVQTAARLPLLPPEKWPDRLQLLAPQLGVLLLLPALVAVTAWPRGRWRTVGFGLPLAAWLASLPLGLAGTLTHGGHFNSLHGAFFLLPAAAIVFAARLPHWQPVPRRLALIAVGVLLGVRLTALTTLPATPRGEMPAEASRLASGHGERLWLPWRPLATRLATGRHDHDEDGLLIRHLTGRPVSRSHLHAHLPPQWASTFLQAGGMNWSVAIASQDPHWVAARLGRWVFFAPRQADSDVGKPPASSHPDR